MLIGIVLTFKFFTVTLPFLPYMKRLQYFVLQKKLPILIVTTSIPLLGKRKSTAIYGTDNLHQAEVPVVPLSECRSSYGTFPLNDRMLCAGYKAGRVDSCAGDSGGPLLARRPSDDRWTVFGVTSFGDGCGQKGKFGIYTNVEKYVKWIRRTVAKNTR